MQTIRRFYVYAVAFISLESVLWGSIRLARSLLAGTRLGENLSLLAGGLSLILVGIPVFIFHWRLAQRSAQKDEEERYSRTRAVFLYAVLLAALLPVAQNILALLDRLLLRVLGSQPGYAMLGQSQTLGENLIAVVVNALAAAYFYYVAHEEWQTVSRGDNFPETRRLYRYLWLIYGLGLTAIGVQQALLFLLKFWQTSASGVQASLANGLALLLVGVPVWFYTRWWIERSLEDPSERNSFLRLVVWYLLALACAVTALISAVQVLNGFLSAVLTFVLKSTFSTTNFLGRFSESLSVALPFAALWVYASRILGVEMKFAPETATDKLQTRRAGLRRLYFYILALLGLGAFTLGLQMGFTYLLEVTVGGSSLAGAALINRFSNALSLVIVGVPLWWITWRSMQGEAAKEGEPGDRTRRSLVRRAYLYVVLFAGVIGVMVGVGMLLYQVLLAGLGGSPEGLLLKVLQQVKLALLFTLLLVYHGRALRADDRMAERSLGKRHAQYPVLILAPDESEFADQLVSAIKRQTPELPVAVHPYSQGIPDDTRSCARAVILPAELAAKPAEAIRLWLQAFDGVRLVIPTPTRGWHWVTEGSWAMSSLARQAAQAVRHLAEEEEIPPSRQASPWLNVVYVLAGLFIFEIVWVLVAMVASLFFQ
jgi:hypothetical protein